MQTLYTELRISSSYGEDLTRQMLPHISTDFELEREVSRDEACELRGSDLNFFEDDMSVCAILREDPNATFMLKGKRSDGVWANIAVIEPSPARELISA